MLISNNVELKLSPREMAQLIWEMYSDEQAEMFAEILKIAGSEHNLMSQFLVTRDHCATSNDPDALAGFQVMFSSAYKYMVWE